MKFDWSKNKPLFDFSLKELFDMTGKYNQGKCCVKSKSTPSFPGKNRARKLRKKMKQSRKRNR